MSLSQFQSSQNFDTKTLAVIEHKGYMVKEKLGEGAYGQVFKALSKDGTQLAAVKVIALLKMSEKSREKFLPREIQTLINAQHTNLIKVFDIFRANQRMYIFMEFAGNGDIHVYIRKNRGIRDTKLACKWFLQASRGLEFLHNRIYTAHRDIKTDNILLADKWIAKLSDYGFSKDCYDPDKQSITLSTTFCGTKPYESPQVLEHKPYNALKADIWSMGVTLFIMLHDRFPFPFKDTKEMLKLISQYPKSVLSKMTRKLPDSGVKFQLSMLNPKEESRASVEDLVNNEWLRSNS